MNSDRLSDNLVCFFSCIAKRMRPFRHASFVILLFVFTAVPGALAAALFGIPAIKGVEFGDGFALCDRRGSQANDAYAICEGKVVTMTNHNGGIGGGITNGMPLIVRVACKPTPSIGQPQQTVDLLTGEDTTMTVHGRHDPCVVPRAVPIVEASVALCLLDAML